MRGNDHGSNFRELYVIHLFLLEIYTIYIQYQFIVLNDNMVQVLWAQIGVNHNCG